MVSEAVYAPKDKNIKATEENLADHWKIMETRLDNLNILDRDIIVDKTNGNVISCDFHGNQAKPL